MQGLRPRPNCGCASEILFGIFRFHQHWKHNRSVIDSEEDSSDEATPDYSHRRNPARPILPSSGPSNTSAISLRAGPWTLQSQQSHLHVSSPAPYYLPAGSPLRLADQARNQRGGSLLAEVREARPVSQRTLPDSNTISQDPVTVRVSPILQDSLPSPTITSDQPSRQSSPRHCSLPLRPESDRESNRNRQPPLCELDHSDASQIALRRINPLRVISAWRRSDTPASDLLPVVLLGFLSNTFLMIGVLLKLSRRQGTPKVDTTQTTLMRNKATPSKKNVIDNYNREGKNYDNIRYGRTKGGRFFSEIELRKTLAMVKGDKVLHVGTATGRVSTYLVSSGFDYVGLELSKVMVRITRERLKGAGDVVQADAEHLPFKPSVFDDVVSVRSFHFLPHPEIFLNEANRVLKRTGRVTVSFEKNVPGREAFRKLMRLPASNAKRAYYSNPQVVLMMGRARFTALFAGNVTKLPLLLYWRSKDDRILKELHGKIPSVMGTVGMVVGSKASL